MLKVLICAGCFSIIVDMIVSDNAGRKTGKLDNLNLHIFCIVQIDYNCLLAAWVEGTAILIAVALVASVGSFVDWRKEKAFVAVKKQQLLKNVVRNLFKYKAK
jgi:hypothetical protein